LIDLEDELGLDQNFPSVSTLTRLFRGLPETKVYEPNRPLVVREIKADIAHDLWQIDDMGAALYPGLGHMGLLNVKDVSSRVQTGIFSKNIPIVESIPIQKTTSKCFGGLLKSLECPKAYNPTEDLSLKKTSPKARFQPIYTYGSWD